MHRRKINYPTTTKKKKCASEYEMCECEYSDVRVTGYVRVEMCECE